MKITSLIVSLALLSASAPTSNAFFVPSTPTFVSTRLHASTLKRLPESAVEVELQAPGKATKAAYEKVCAELSKKVSIPGFRKGARIPPQVLEQSMAAKGGRNALKVQAINTLFSELIESALKEEHGLEPIGTPSLVTSAEELAESFKPGDDLSLVVKCDVWPDIQWKTVEGKEKPYMGLAGTYKRAPFDDAKFNKAMSDLRERYVTLEPIDSDDHQLEMGDSCTVNMEGFMATEDGEKGEPLPNAASGDRVEVIMGEGRYMTGLVEGLVGAKVGETRQVSVTFPEALRDKTLAGKKAVFDVSVLEASKRTLPEVTDEFAEIVRSGLTKESLEDELRKAVDAEDAKEFVPARNAALSAALAQVLDVDVPDTLVTNQARDKFAMMMTDMRNSGVSDEEIKKQISPENFEKYKKIVKDDIIKDFKVSMATDEIARLEKIDVPAYQVEEQLESVKTQAAKDNEEIDETVMRTKIEATLQRQLVMDFLAENGDLRIEFTDDNEFDEGLMEELAQSTIKAAEEEGDGAASADVVDATIVEDEEEEATTAPVAEKEEEPKAEDKEEEDRDYGSMTLEEKAYFAVKDSGALET
mmetsp:Transcript_14152/g.40332  ORF Transcript_14152/g.40332 Transcript_14152/m.40332 type:complete len:586 (+) Transcript_14152:241-1998(+)